MLISPKMMFSYVSQTRRAEIIIVIIIFSVAAIHLFLPLL